MVAKDNVPDLKFPPTKKEWYTTFKDKIETYFTKQGLYKYMHGKARKPKRTDNKYKLITNPYDSVTQTIKFMEAETFNDSRRNSFTSHLEKFRAKQAEAWLLLITMSDDTIVSSLVQKYSSDRNVAQAYQEIMEFYEEKDNAAKATMLLSYFNNDIKFNNGQFCDENPQSLHLKTLKLFDDVDRIANLLEQIPAPNTIFKTSVERKQKCLSELLASKSSILKVVIDKSSEATDYDAFKTKIIDELNHSDMIHNLSTPTVSETKTENLKNEVTTANITSLSKEEIQKLPDSALKANIKSYKRAYNQMRQVRDSRLEKDPNSQQQDYNHENANYRGRGRGRGRSRGYGRGRGRGRNNDGSYTYNNQTSNPTTEPQNSVQPHYQPHWRGTRPDNTGRSYGRGYRGRGGRFGRGGGRQHNYNNYHNPQYNYSNPNYYQNRSTPNSSYLSSLPPSYQASHSEHNQQGPPVYLPYSTDQYHTA